MGQGGEIRRHKGGLGRARPDEKCLLRAFPLCPGADFSGLSVSPTTIATRAKLAFRCRNGRAATGPRIAVTLPSPGDTAGSAHSFPRSHKPGRPIRYRADISDKYSQRASQRSHTADRHRRRSCDAAPEKTAARERRKLGIPMTPLQSASWSLPFDTQTPCSLKAEETDQSGGGARGEVGVVHVNVDCRI